MRLTNVEEALAGKPATDETIAAASKLAGAGLDDINSDIHAERGISESDDRGVYASAR